jgi:transketolase
MRALPNMVVVAPNDPVESRLATRAIAAHNGPCYLRLGRAGEPVIHHSEPDFQLGKAIKIRNGSDLTMLVTGGLLGNALIAAENLHANGIDVRVLSVPTIRPLDSAAVLDAARETNALFTIEEHSVVGGLGGAVAEILMEDNQQPIKFKRIGLKSIFSSKVGTQDYLRGQHGLDAAGITATISNTLGLGI